MEYRRRKRYRSAQSRPGGAGAAKTIVALLVIAAIVYVISASTVGAWIAKKVIAPAFSAFDNLLQSNTEKDAPAAENAGGIDMQSGAPGEKSVTDEVLLPGVECYALQMGVFSNWDNANTQAAQLQQRGAGGYVMDDAGKYRVLAAAYAAQDSLKQVREQLDADGVESASYVFNAPDSTLRVTGTPKQLDGITAGFQALTAIMEEMAETSLAFDQQRQTADQGRETAKTLLTRIEDARTAFSMVATMAHPVLEATKSCFDEYETAMRALSAYSSQSFVDFSSKMKYTHLKIVCSYLMLAQKIAEI
ncbi:MAG: SPOR domain-containing protein [Clostridiales bacterium]|jgi:hypothetical protein|nr:SPOR domain-containing protein [Clostridiales bacterium]